MSFVFVTYEILVLNYKILMQKFVKIINNSKF